MKKWALYTCLMLAPIMADCQNSLDLLLTPSDSLHTKRRNSVFAIEASLFTASLIGLNQLWYQDYDQSEFHMVDDSGDWLQMDKFGHVFSSYHLGRLGANSLKWSGASSRERLIFGSTMGFAFLTAVEIMDGYSQKWGFSWSDMVANATGTALYASQDLLWKEQRMTLKYSFRRTSYAKQRPGTLGNGFLEEVLKDYNGQTYWLSINLKSFFRTTNLPGWVNLAVGIGADGLLTSDGKAIDGLYQNQNITRQYYLSIDIDLTRIQTNSHILNTLFDVFNTLKVPFPALEFNGKNGIRLHGIYF